MLLRDVLKRNARRLDWIHLHGVAEKCYSHWSNSHTFTSCFPSNGVVNYWCKHHVSLPPTVPLPSSLLRGSPSSTESPRNTHSTRSLGQDPIKPSGWGGCTPDVPINCFLLYNSVIFVFYFFSFYPFHSVILAAMPEATYTFLQGKEQTATPTKLCGSLSSDGQKKGVSLQTKLSAVMLLVLKLKQRAPLVRVSAVCSCFILRSVSVRGV